MRLASNDMGLIAGALQKYGSATQAVLKEDFESWPIGTALRLFALMMREIAEAEMKRRERDK